MYYNDEGSIESSNTIQKVKCIKGWLCKFAPYSKNKRKRTDLEKLSYIDPFFDL